MTNLFKTKEKMRKNKNVLLRGPIFFLSRYVNEDKFDVKRNWPKKD